MSEALKILQARCGVTADGSFGPNTARAIAKHYELSDKSGAHLLGKLTMRVVASSAPKRVCIIAPLND